MKTVIVAAICLAVALSSPAFAKNNGNHGNGHGKSKGRWENSESYNHGGGKHSGRSDREVLREYVLGHYRKNCPPGLAKKNPPCIPPGQAKKFSVGDHLPEGGYEPLPDYVLDQLTPPQHGMYVRMDRNVYLITEGTRKVLDAIELFSAVD